MELDGIFMPQARRQRDDFSRRQAKPGENAPNYLRFAHYTSAEAALSIIKSKRVWMRNATCMPDYREVQHGIGYLKDFFGDRARYGLFVSEFDKCFPGVAQEALVKFGEWEQDITLDSYISSVSEHDDAEDLHGRLSMWRAFGGSSARVAIVLKIPWKSGAGFSLKIIFSPVAYLTKDQAHAVIAEAMQNLKAKVDFLRSFDRSIVLGYILTMFIAGVTCLKHEGFHEEREWRAIYSPNRMESPWMESCVQTVGGIPQIIYQLPLDSGLSPELADLDFPRVFDRVIIGPSPYPWVLYKVFAKALKDAGVDQAHERVRVSGIPIRV